MADLRINLNSRFVFIVSYKSKEFVIVPGQIYSILILMTKT